MINAQVHVDLIQRCGCHLLFTWNTGCSNKRHLKFRIKDLQQGQLKLGCGILIMYLQKKRRAPGQIRQGLEIQGIQNLQALTRVDAYGAVNSVQSAHARNNGYGDPGGCGFFQNELHGGFAD